MDPQPLMALRVLENVMQEIFSKETGSLLIYLGIGTFLISGTFFLVLVQFYEPLWFLVLMTLVAPPVILSTGILLRLFGSDATEES